MRVSKFVNGINIYAFSNFDEIIDEAVFSKKILIALNSDKLQYCDNNLKTIINSNIGYCDGIGAVWALNRKGVKNVVKIPGCELWLALVKRFPTSKYYLVGAEPGISDIVAEKLKLEYPGIQILAHRDGFIRSENEKELLISNICEVSPDFLFVAMGSPKQEIFLNEVHRKLDIPMMGLGGSFNVYSGKVKRAPKWMLKLNLETAYRYIFCGIKFSRIKSDWLFIYKLIMNKL